MLLEARNLAFSYGKTPVLCDVSLSLNSGQLVALLGPNGSGKSTLIKLLLGQLHGQGEIVWENRAIRSWNRRELARVVAYLPQNPLHDPQHRVADILRLGRSPYWSAFGVESAHDIEIVRQVSAQLALDNLLPRFMDELSGGQRQRVFVARCLVQQPRAMLLDEPNTFLDLKHQLELLQLLRKLASEQSIGILMASHDINLAAAFADRIILLDNGAVAGAGTVDEVMRPELLARVYGASVERIDRDGRAPVIVPVTREAKAAEAASPRGDAKSSGN